MRFERLVLRNKLRKARTNKEMKFAAAWARLQNKRYGEDIAFILRLLGRAIRKRPVNIQIRKLMALQRGTQDAGDI